MIIEKTIKPYNDYTNNVQRGIVLLPRALIHETVTIYIDGEKFTKKVHPHGDGCCIKVNKKYIGRVMKIEIDEKRLAKILINNFKRRVNIFSDRDNV